MMNPSPESKETWDFLFCRGPRVTDSRKAIVIQVANPVAAAPLCAKPKIIARLSVHTKTLSFRAGAQFVWADPKLRAVWTYIGRAMDLGVMGRSVCEVGL